MEFRPQPDVPLLDLPDDITIPQFVFDRAHSSKPSRAESIPWLIDDASGRQLGGTEVRMELNVRLSGLIDPPKLKRRTLGLSNALHRRYGVGRDDVVLLFSRNHVDYPVAIWATHQLGGVISGANPDFSRQELVYQINEANARLLVVHPQSAEVALLAARDCGIPQDRVILFDVEEQNQSKLPTVEQLIQEGLRAPILFSELKLKPGEGRTKLAFLSFSSGTTGKPKAVAIAHYSLIVNVIQWCIHHKANEEYTEWSNRRYRPGDVAIGVLPFYHIYGLVLNLHASLHAGMSILVIPKFNINSLLDSVVRHRVTHLFLVPPLVVQICKHPNIQKYGISDQIRMVVCGAAPLTHELNVQLFELFPKAHIGQAYGMTETCTATMAWPINQRRGVPGSSGHLLPGTSARVVKFDGTLASHDEPGELWIKTPSVSLGYANNAQATKETFIDGWVRTGDEVLVDKDGEIKVLDRIKEIMKVRGFQVAPAELEGCLLEHPDVDNACVVGIPDDYSGEVPLAFIVLSAEASRRAQDPVAEHGIRDSILKHVADQKVTYKRLTGGVEFITQIPTSPSGKLLRRILREQAKKLKRETLARPAKL